jgi:hypothetical protein
MSVAPAFPPTASTTTPRSRWNHWYTLTLFLGAGWILWSAVVIGRLSLSGGDPVPRALNAIALTGLSVGALMTFIVGKDHNRRTDDQHWQSVIGNELRHVRAEYQAAVRELVRIKDRLGLREDDDPTVPLAGRTNGHRTLYAASASVATVQIDGVLNTLRERVDQQVDEAIGAKVQEFGAQQWYAGYAAGREDDGGSVVALQPRNGHRSTS